MDFVAGKLWNCFSPVYHAPTLTRRAPWIINSPRLFIIQYIHPLPLYYWLNEYSLFCCRTGKMPFMYFTHFHLRASIGINTHTETSVYALSCQKHLYKRGHVCRLAWCANCRLLMPLERKNSKNPPTRDKRRGRAAQSFDSGVSDCAWVLAAMRTGF